MFKAFSIFIFFIFNLNYGYAQESKDTLSKVYELEPVYFSEKLGKIDYTILNYFSTRNKVPVQFHMPLFIGGGGFSQKSSNYGVLLQKGKKTSKLFLKEVSFLAPIEDSINIKTASYYLIIEKEKGALERKLLTVKDKNIAKASGAKNILFESNLVTIHFELEEIAFTSKEKVYFFRQDEPSSIRYSSVVVVGTKKDNSYILRDNDKIEPLRIIAKEADIDLLYHVWQIRLKYRAY